MLGWVLLLSVAASPSTPRELAVMRFQMTQLNAELAGFAEDRLARELTRHGFKVVTPATLETLLGVERQKQLMGCTEESNSCLAELGAALGMPLIATARLTRLGDRIEFDMQVLRQRDAVVVARIARAVEGEKRLGELIADAAKDLAEQLADPVPAAPFRARLWIPVFGGLAALAGGGVLLGVTQASFGSYTTPGTAVPTLVGGDVHATFARLDTQRAFGWSLVGLGAAAIAFGIVWNAVAGEPPPVSAQLGLDEHGVAVSLGGRF